MDTYQWVMFRKRAWWWMHVVSEINISLVLNQEWLAHMAL